MNEWIFGVSVIHQDDDYIVHVRDLPEVVTSGNSLEEALINAADAIETSIAFRIAKGDALPVATPILDNEAPVSLSARIAAKASVYRAWHVSGISKTELARRMNRNEAEVRRILDPGHGTKLDQLEEAARALGGRLLVTFSATAGE